MAINFAKERIKFEKDQERLRKEYAKAGMNEDQIKAMYEFDLNQFNRNIAYGRWTQPLMSEDGDEDIEEGKCPLLKKFLDNISVTSEPSMTEHFWWLDEIDDDELIESLKKLSEAELELLDLVVFQEYSQLEIGIMQHKSQASVSQRINTIRKKLKK